MLHVGDPVGLWSELGFVVDDDCCVVGGIRLHLGAGEPGLTGWPDERPVDGGPDRHPNAVVALDHLVLSTSDLDRTITELEECRGLELRRVRDAGRGIRQAFFRLPGTILEVVGPGPDRWYGLAFVSADLDATAAYLGDRLRPPKDAVQPGRRIATLDRDAGSTVPIAFMTPHRR